MNAARIAEYEDTGLIDGIAPYLRWQPTPPNHVALGQWSNARDAVAVYIDDHPDGGLVWWAWRYVPGSEGAVEKLSAEARAEDEAEARIAAELWVRRNYRPVSRQADVAIMKARLKAKRDAIKDGVMPIGMPAYRFWLLTALAVATAILLFQISFLVAPQLTVMFVIVVGGIGTAVYFTIDRATAKLDEWTKRGRRIVKEIK